MVSQAEAEITELLAVKLAVVAAIGISVAVLTLIVVTLWNRGRKEASAIAALVGLVGLGALAILAWGSAGLGLFLIVLLAVALSPVLNRLRSGEGLYP